MSIYHHEPNPGEMFADTCRSVGFQVVECDQFETDYTYESAQHANGTHLLINSLNNLFGLPLPIKCQSSASFVANKSFFNSGFWENFAIKAS